MIIGSISENKDEEKRISITPDLVKKYISLGFKVLIEKNYGEHLGFLNEDYKKEGCEIEDKNSVIEKSDIILQLNLPKDENLSLIKEKKLLIGVFNSFQNNEKLISLAKKNINIFSLELLPRISRAQSMDILSSQANLAGYKSVIDSFAIFLKAVPMMMTAAGTIPAARVLVVGAGVAGLLALLILIGLWNKK